MTRLPEQRLADAMVEKLNLAPPVDVFALLQARAEVTVTHLLSDTDAVVAGLTDVMRPKVFINANKPRTRQLFTMAHELAHIVLPWHVGDSSCEPKDASLMEDVEEHLPSVGDMEAEADRFAAALMVPIKFLDGLAEDLDIAIAQLETTGLSTVAALRSLAAWAKPGLVMVMTNDDGTIEHVFRSPGTPSGHFLRDGRVDVELAARADRVGRMMHRSRTVRWFRFDGPAFVEPTSSWTGLLSTILARRPVHHGRERVAGIAGAANSARLHETPTQMAGHLRRTMRMDPDLWTLTDDPLFNEFAFARAWSLFGLAP